MEASLKGHFRNPLTDLAILVAAAFIVSIPMFLWGIPFGNDLAQHYQFAQQFEAAIRNGSIYPSWGTGTNHGLGDVGIRFYPPASYYVLILFKIITGSWYYGSMITFAFWFFLGALGCYLLGREWLGRKSSIVAGLMFMLLPYHVNQIFNAFLYAEFAAASVIPFCFLFVTRIFRRNKIADVAGLATTVALLILTHLPTAIMGTIALSVYVVLLLSRKDAVSTITRLLAGVVLGLLACSFYWIKLVKEIAYVNHSSPEFTATTFDFHGNFLAAYFYVSSEQYASRALFFGDAMLLLTVGLTISALIALLTVRALKDKFTRAVLAVFMVGVFFATPLSLPVWESVGLLQKIQFPFRWMTIVTLTSAMLAGSAFAFFGDLIHSRKRPIALVLIGLTLFCVVFSIAQVIRPAIYIREGDFNSKLDRITKEESCECWWPVWAKREALSEPSSITENNGSLRVNHNVTQLPVRLQDDGRSVVDIFYYPFWRVTIGEHLAETGPDNYGRLSFPLAAARDRVEIRFEEPKYVVLAWFASILGWLTILVVMGGSIRSTSPFQK